MKPIDNLKTGQGEFSSPEKAKYIPADRPKQVKPTDNLTTGHGEFVVPEKSQPRGKTEALSLYIFIVRKIRKKIIEKNGQISFQVQLKNVRQSNMMTTLKREKGNSFYRKNRNINRLNVRNKFGHKTIFGRKDRLTNQKNLASNQPKERNR